MTSINDLYQYPVMQASGNIAARVDFFSRLFLGKPYILGAQGEGPDGEFDQSPLYRFDGFDCVTYVNNILALAFSNDPAAFEKTLLALNYYESKPLFENRFHFMSVDWNPQNQQNHFLKDVTETIVDSHQKPITIYAEGEIDKPSWFLKRIGIAVGACQFARLPYLPLTALFDANKNPIAHYFNQLPDLSIVEIVRPNWHLKEKIGTNLHVSHVGFAIRQPSGELLFRHASSESKGVVEVLLSDYLKNVLGSETIKGINVQGIRNISTNFHI